MILRVSPVFFMRARYQISMALVNGKGSESPDPDENNSKVEIVCSEAQRVEGIRGLRTP